MNTVTETITPQIAIEYLKRNNPDNRKISRASVEDYARQMARGEFRHTHQGIGFLEDGTLGDGQHRLLGVVKSGCTVQMNVSYGLTKEDLLAVDRGRSRSVRDVVKIAGVDKSVGYEPIGNSKMVSTLSQLVECNYQKMRLNSNEVVHLFNAFQTQATYVFENIITKACGKGCQSPAFAAGVAAMYCGVDKDTVRKFFEVFTKADIAGCDGLNVRAVLNWRQQIDSMKAKRIHLDREKMYLGTQNAIYHFANNTSTTSIRVPATPRYDVRSKIMEALT